MYADDVWLTERVLLSEVLERALVTSGWGGRPQRGDILDELADHLGIDPVNLRDAGYYLLWDLLESLRINVSDEGSGSWVDDMEAQRHTRIAGEVVKDACVDDLLLAAQQFGWRRLRVTESEFQSIASEVRKAFSAKLAQQIYKLLERWRKKNVWNQDLGLATRRRRSA